MTIERGASTRQERSEEIRTIIDEWTADLTETHDDRDAEAVDSYKSLARAILEHGLDPASRGEPLPVDCLERLLTRVARASRRTDRSIASILERFGRLTPRAVDVVARDDGLSDDTLEVLRTAANVDHVLDYSMRRLVEILEAAARRAHREQADALAAVTEILSHELDNRLGAARTASDILLSPDLELDAEKLEQVRRLVRSSVDDALKTVDDVRTLISSWGDQSGERGRPGAVRLRVLLRSIVRELAAMADESGVDVEVAADGANHLVDAARLRLILFNLIANAVKYHDPQKDERWVRIESAEMEDGRLRLEVADNGIGIAHDELEDVFLYRRRANQDRSVDGSGLGLAIVSEAVDQLGGVVSVESERGEGTRFTVLLSPLDPDR